MPNSVTKSGGNGSDSRYLEVYKLVGDEWVFQDRFQDVFETNEFFLNAELGEYEIRQPKVSVSILQGIGAKHPDVDVDPPLAPAGLLLTNQQTNSIQVIWTSNTEPDIQDYRIYKSTTSADSGFGVPIATVGAPGNSYTDSAFDASIQTWYKITARDLAGNESDFSSVEASTFSGFVVGGQHSYYELLAAEPATTRGFPLYGDGDVFTDQIAPAVWTQVANYNTNSIDYDPVEEAAIQKFGVNDGNGVNMGLGNGQNPDLNIAANSGTAFFYWENKWGDVWAQKDPDGSVGGMNTHKEFILYGDAGPGRAVEIRTSYNNVEGVVGTPNVRLYGSAEGVTAGTVGSGDTLEPKVGSLDILPDRWIYYWAFLDFDNDTLSLWIQDSQAGAAIKVYDECPVIYENDLQIDGFLFRHNSSQSRVGPATSMWNRHVVVMENITLVQAQAYVDAR